jgi:hypothetical protein
MSWNGRNAYLYNWWWSLDSELGDDSHNDDVPVILMFKTTAEQQSVCSTNQSVEDFDWASSIADPDYIDPRVNDKNWHDFISSTVLIKIQTQDLFVQSHNQHSLDFLKW